MARYNRDNTKGSLTARRTARKEYERAKKKPLGEGSRFAAIEKSAKLGGARDPKAVAAAVMWKKYGKKGGAAILRKAR